MSSLTTGPFHTLFSWGESLSRRILLLSWPVVFLHVYRTARVFSIRLRCTFWVFLVSSHKRREVELHSRPASRSLSQSNPISLIYHQLSLGAKIDRCVNFQVQTPCLHSLIDCSSCARRSTSGLRKINRWQREATYSVASIRLAPRLQNTMPWSTRWLGPPLICQPLRMW